MSNMMIDIFKSLGRNDALNLRNKAVEMTGTEIIASEYCVPAWSAEKDYSAWPAGSPVTDEGQVWTLIIPHNAAHYQGRPSELRALWGLTHTKDPAKAKPWVDPLGTSGMYMADECYKDTDGKVYRCKFDNTVFDAVTHPAGWEDLTIKQEGGEG